MKCEDIRVLLAAYRRGEWSLEEQRTVSKHLAGCPACRRWEANARQVGERLRLLPTITPPADFRDRVFAAIQADQQLFAAAREGKTATPETASSATTRAVRILDRKPSYAERIGEVAVGNMRPPRTWLGKHTAIATVAALLAIIFSIRFVPFVGEQQRVQTGSQVVGVCQAGNVCVTVPYRVTVDKNFPTVTSALANQHQIIYVAHSTSGQQMVFLKDRDTGTPPINLLSTASSQPISLSYLSAKMLVWQKGYQGSSDWALQANLLTDIKTQLISQTSSIPLLTIGQTIQTLTQSYKVDKLVSLWADGQSTVMVITTANNENILVRADVLDGAATPLYTVITQAAPGHIILDPYIDGQTIYWVDKVFSTPTTTQDTIWQAAPNQAPVAAVTGTNIFNPIASGGRIAWFQEKPVLAIVEPGDTAAMPSGSILSQDSPTDSPHVQWQDLMPNASIQRGPGYILWHDQGGMHAYHFSSGQRFDYNNTIPNVKTLWCSSDSIAWVNVSAPAGNPATVQVIDLG